MKKELLTNEPPEIKDFQKAFLRLTEGLDDRFESNKVSNSNFLETEAALTILEELIEDIKADNITINPDQKDLILGKINSVIQIESQREMMITGSGGKLVSRLEKAKEAFLEAESTRVSKSLTAVEALEDLDDEIKELQVTLVSRSIVSTIKAAVRDLQVMQDSESHDLSDEDLTKLIDVLLLKIQEIKNQVTQTENQEWRDEDQDKIERIITDLEAKKRRLIDQAASQASPPPLPK